MQSWWWLRKASQSIKRYLQGVQVEAESMVLPANSSKLSEIASFPEDVLGNSGGIYKES